MLNDVKSNVSILKISFVFVQYNLLLYLTTKSTEKATHCLLLEKKLFLLKEREKKNGNARRQSEASRLKNGVHFLKRSRSFRADVCINYIVPTHHFPAIEFFLVLSAVAR